MSILDISQGKQQQQSRNNIYICGFLSNRLHNDQLYSVARDLMVSFYVCTNPTALSKWNRKETINLLSQCDAMVFWLNRYTLNDHVSLMTLQLATELNVHVIMIRHPRTRLVINPVLALNNQQPLSSDLVQNSGSDMRHLQYAVFEGYRQSLEYDRNKHQLCLQLLIKRITSTISRNNLNINNSSSAESSHTISSENLMSENNTAVPFLKLPSLNAVDYRRATGFGRFSRSCSVDNVKFPSTLQQQQQQHMPISNGLLKQYNKKAIAIATPNRRRLSLPRIIRLKKSQTLANSENKDYINDSNMSKRQSLFDSTPDLTRPSYRTTDDPDLYHFTQYLVFPLTDKTHKPRLVNFPMDILNRGDTDVDVESIWGSDASLSEEANLAPTLQGDLLISSPPSTPAPYIEPL